MTFACTYMCLRIKKLSLLLCTLQYKIKQTGFLSFCLSQVWYIINVDQITGYIKEAWSCIWILYTKRTVIIIQNGFIFIPKFMIGNLLQIIKEIEN